MIAVSISRLATTGTFICVLVVGHAGTFPLEWNAGYDTSIPHEVELQPTKLVRCGLMKPGEGFKVIADGKPLSVLVLDGKAPESVRLRFAVPPDTLKLPPLPSATAAALCAMAVKTADKLARQAGR